MSTLSLFLIAVGLSMDAFAVAICKGLATRKLKLSNAFIVGLYFGGFQILMPLAGYLLANRFEKYITSFDHWIAFALLSIIGISMIRESRSEAEKLDDSFTVKVMLPLAVATSIDALAAGVSFAFLGVNIIQSVLFIGVITFTLSTIGVYVGNIFGAKYKSGAELCGGIVLVAMGVKILLEHLGIIG